MKKKTRNILLTALVCIIGFLVTNITFHSDYKTYQDNESNSYISYHFDYKMYKDNESLVNDADTIVIGTVVKVNKPEEIEIGNNILSAEEEKVLPQKTSFIYTVSDIKIEKVLKGNYEVGDIFKIKQLGDAQKRSFEDVKYLEQDSRHIFFLRTYPKEDIPASVLNPIQGQIELYEGKIVKQEHNKLFENVVNKKEIIEIIEKAIKEKSDK